MVPAIAKEYAEMISESTYPRILRWKTKMWNKRNSPKLSDISNTIAKEEVSSYNNVHII